MADFAVTIYHNPACSTSRNVLAAIRAAGIEPRIIEYLKAPPYETLGLHDPALSDDAIFTAIAKEPVLIERPIVSTPKGVSLCRPASRITELLP